MSTTTSTLTFTSCCHQFATKPPTANTSANTTVAPTKNLRFFPPTKLNKMPRLKSSRPPKPPPTLAKALSSELGDADLGLTQRHNSGRPMRKQARQAPTGGSPFIDSAIASDESDFELTSDEEVHVMPRNRKRKRSSSPPVASIDQRTVSSDSEQENAQTALPDHATKQDGHVLQKATQINISNLTIVLPPGHVGPVTLQINPTSFTPFLAAPNGQIPTFYPVTKTPVPFKADPVVPVQKKRTGFLDLPAELRNEIYRLTFVKEDRLHFGTPKGFSRSAALLRTCKQVHTEGASILYSENKFHFCRRTSRFGSFWEDDWRELGFRSVHSFVKTIGPVNLGLLRHISFQFEDATPCLNPDSMTHDERRFVNDDVLMSTLRHLAEHTRLQRLDMNFHGRRRVERSDGRFLEYLQRVRADTVQFVTYPIGLETTWAMESKQDEAVRKMLLKAMVRKRKIYS